MVVKLLSFLLLVVTVNRSIEDCETYEFCNDNSNLETIIIPIESIYQSKKNNICVNTSCYRPRYSRNQIEAVQLHVFLQQNRELVALLLRQISTFQSHSEDILKNDPEAVYAFFNDRFLFEPWQQRFSVFQKKIESLVCDNGIPRDVSADNLRTYKIAHSIRDFAYTILSKDEVEKWIAQNSTTIPAFKHLCDNTVPDGYWSDLLCTIFTFSDEKKSYSIYTNPFTKELQQLQDAMDKGAFGLVFDAYTRYTRSQDAHSLAKARVLGKTCSQRGQHYIKQLYRGPYCNDPLFKEMDAVVSNTSAWDRKARVIFEYEPQLEERHKVYQALLKDIGAPGTLSSIITDSAYTCIDSCGDTQKIVERLAVLSSDSKDQEVQNAYHLFYTAEGLPKVGSFDYWLVEKKSMPKIGLQKHQEQRIILGKLCATAAIMEDALFSRLCAIDCIRNSCKNDEPCKDYYFRLAKNIYTAIIEPDGQLDVAEVAYLVKQLTDPLMIPDRAVYDFVSTAATNIVQISTEIDARIESALRQLHERYQHFEEYISAANELLQDMKGKGLLTPDNTLREAIFEGLFYYFEELKPSDPLEHPGEFVSAVATYAYSFAISIIGGNKVQQIQKILAIGSQLNQWRHVDTTGLTTKEVARLIAQQAADITKMIVCDRVVKKAMPVMQRWYDARKVPSTLTTEGIVIDRNIGHKDLLSSKINSKNHIVSTKDPITVNECSIAILKDGYYEVNGLKFTQYYYNRLWNGGRKAPSLIAQAILDNAAEILPDPKGCDGFYKYVSDGWYMIYNPTTKIVSHLEPLK
jgi:hypothetical protein